MTLAKRLTGVWAVLLVLTFGSFAVGIEQSDRLTFAATLVIIGVAMLKVRFIGLHFMDLRIAPRPLRMIYEAWIVVVFIVLGVLAVPLGT